MRSCCNLSDVRDKGPDISLVTGETISLFSSVPRFRVSTTLSANTSNTAIPDHDSTSIAAIYVLRPSVTNLADYSLFTHGCTPISFVSSSSSFVAR